jgi:AcrR family transcriptional regulator
MAVQSLRRARRPVNMAALAKELGVSRATLYRQVGSATDVEALVGESVGQRRSNEEVFAAVKAVMGERGLRGTTLEAVAERAGVSAVTLHRRFGDRLGLLRAFLDAIPTRRVGRALASADPWRVHDVLLDFTRRALSELEGSLEVMRAMLADPLAFEELSTKARDPARGVSAGVVAYFTRCVTAGSLGGDPRALTTAYLSTLFGFGLMARTMARDQALASPSNVAMLVSTFLEGAVPRSRRC